MPTITRRAPAAVAALALVAVLAFAAPAYADDLDPTTVPEEVTTTEVTDPLQVLPPEEEPTEDEGTDEQGTDEQGTDEQGTDEQSPDPQIAPAFAARTMQFSIESVPVAPIACVAIPGWASEDLTPVLTDAGLVFDGPHAQAVNYFQRVSAGNAQGLTGMSYTLAAGTTGYKADLKVEVDPNADLGSGVIHYATLSTINTASTGTIDAQNAQWFTTKIAYASPGGLGNPLSWDDLIALMPNNTLLSAPSLHLQTNSTADSHSIVTSVTSSCGTTDFTSPPPTNTGCLAAPTVVTIDQAADLSYDSRSGGSSSVTAKGLEVAWHGPDLTQSKVAWYYATDFSLSELGTPSISYTQTSGASVGQNFTIEVDGAWKGNIVKEPGVSDYWTTFSIPGMSADPAFSYRKAVGTIDDFLAAYWADSHQHDVRVIAVGGSGGSGSEGVGIVKHQAAGCVDLTFGVPAPTVEQCIPANLVNVAITTPSQLFYDSRTGGASSVTSKGLEVSWHGPNLTQSKVAWYYATNFPLYKLGTPSIAYDITSGASVGQNFVIAVDGAWKGTIVKEPGIANYWTTFSIPGMSADPTASYRKAIGTIQDFVNAYWLDDMTHDVRVIAVGGSGGSGSEGVGIVHSQTAGCYALTYGIPAVVVTPPSTTPTTPTTGTGATGTTAGAVPTPTPTATPTPTPTATPSATPAPTDTQDELPTEAFQSEPTSGDAPWWPWAVGVAILLLLALLWFLFFRRRSNNES